MKKFSPCLFKSIVIILSITTFLYNCISYSAPLIRKGEKKIHDTEYSQIDLSEQTSQKENSVLSTDLKRLKSFSIELESMKMEMYEMRERSRIWDLDYFPPEEHDRIESLLFRYLAIRSSLWEMVNFYKDYREHFSDPESETRGFIIGYSAGLLLTSNSSLLVATFINEPAGKSKLNEEYPRSNIPEGTFDMLVSSVTSVAHMEAIKVAWILFSNERKDESSILYKIYSSDPEYRSIIDKINVLYNNTEERIKYILKENSLLFPKTVNRLRHSAVVKIAEKMNAVLGDNLYAIRGLLFTNVSDIKLPMTKPLSFSADQRNLVHSLLQPGDIILTYTAGYMSNIFLPGKFKHGIIYVGTPVERNRIGLSNDPSSLIAGIDPDKLRKNFTTEYLDPEHRADVIEAVAEGVIFNSLDLLMDTHINKMLVLRPRITREEKSEELIIAFALLGSDYDFKFDFNDGSYQCCTEVIYRALNSRGRCNFNLVKRMGTFTLSADDILNYHFTVDPRPFDIILYAEKAPLSRKHKAKIYTGDDGLKRVRKLMK